MSVEAVEGQDLLDVLSGWQADEVPPGWFRVTQIARRVRVAPQRLREVLADKKKRGEIELECRRFKIECFDGSHRSIAHYRVTRA